MVICSFFGRITLLKNKLKLSVVTCFCLQRVTYQLYNPYAPCMEYLKFGQKNMVNVGKYSINGAFGSTLAWSTTNVHFLACWDIFVA